MELTRSELDPVPAAAMRPAARGRSLGARVRTAVVAGAMLIASGLLPVAPAHADPDPSTKELTEQAHRLADRLEQLTEKYNGLRVQLAQAKRAAKVAAANAARQEEALEAIREKVSTLAATTYMQSGVDPAVAMITGEDPQQLLDQAATLRYFATQDGTKVQGLMEAMQAAQRARKSAEDRARQVETLRAQLERQRKEVVELYEKIRGQVIKRDPEALVELPVVGDGKAAQALRHAMTKLGKPYVWGAAGPNAFDCSGLVMWAYKQVGINLPHYTGSQWNAGTRISRSQLAPGDLVFFYSDLHHVGLYIGNGKMIHAPRTGDVVKIDSIDGRPYAGAVRVA
ncbi:MULTISPECIES: NlpC/P60 family protein [Thermomonospora]|uniref:NLP/P60 protein n=1 Tax=Thermomonospora curvata (strain ATCC 19995 / DSM 43183 / JCM 3096 / KCTC 9072 / NBRC 15933 / NCIMB 10081 / Henssen B9) TaxID=471852 RepID=D1A4D3_THECD|nr:MULTISPECIES: NlpC/P60 family protein [Thermomonospora]ACZ00008.1 NLP/P60 protein [Thermomonospora curvata DSM 43183]PKK12226.1 MAG: NlpC/P60 family protein [Thermomonospora sp. CIF 1]